MRLDKFLSCVNIVKRRSISSDMIAHNVVFLNKIVAKASKEVKVGDEIEIKYLDETKKYRVLALPVTKSTPKIDSCKYWEQI